MDAESFGNSNVLVSVARDKSGARILWKGQLAAIASPLADGTGIRVEGDDVLFDIPSSNDLSAQFVRAIGPMFQGLLAGVEYLGKEEESSSTIDLERPEHIRFEPNPELITMPLAAYVTEQ